MDGPHCGRRTAPRRASGRSPRSDLWCASGPTRPMRSRDREPDHCPMPPPRTVHWADAAALRPRASGRQAAVEIVAGCDDRRPDGSVDHLARTRLPSHGRRGRGRLGKDHPPGDDGRSTRDRHWRQANSQLVILCAGAAGPLEPYLDLPHVRAAAIARAAPRGHSPFWNRPRPSVPLHGGGRRRPRRLGARRQGRHGATRGDRVARGGPRPVHVVMATRRPTAVLTPTLRAAYRHRHRAPDGMRVRFGRDHRRRRSLGTYPAMQREWPS